MSERRTALIGALIVALGPVSLSLYSPALPMLTGIFHTSMAALSLTITVYFLGFAFAQLACGPLSDAYGRRPVAIGFYAVYLLGSLIAILAPTIGILMVGRVLQGVGVAAGITISRAFVRDQFTGAAAARIMNLIGLMLAIGPGISPTLGGLILTFLGWHAIFVVMALYGVLAILVLIFWTRETNRRPDPGAARPARVMRNYLTLATSRRFMRPGLLLALTVGGYYTFAPLMPFVLIQRVGLSPPQFGLAMAMQSVAYGVGSVLTGRLLRRFDYAMVLALGLWMVALSGAAFAICLLCLPLCLPVVMIPSVIWAFGISLVTPGATTAALAGFPLMAGSASALAGFLQMGGGLLGSWLASSLFADPAVAIGLSMPIMAFLALLVQYGLRTPGEGDPQSQDEPLERAPAPSAGPLGDARSA
ncbi:MFS transporter, DHA1 family, bicyclomycin/chloramphenicol resistance protein [Arboricoccus pini]|uniref:Bcr/CflA family efflux transporter n=2 Tax=Arboricoccus pini TaxID=1963835 RepID=A0A212PX41_9PROT|nr:MFS transporter, DHA1 family, bicyclomycin/chloramphenicol resistance protein [Arboricoccus pini]